MCEKESRFTSQMSRQRIERNYNDTLEMATISKPDSRFQFFLYIEM